MATLRLSCDACFVTKEMNKARMVPVLVKELGDGSHQIGFLKEGKIIWMISFSENRGVECWGENDIPESFRDAMPHLKMAKLFFNKGYLQMEYLG